MTAGHRRALQLALLALLAIAPFVLPEFGVTLANYIGLYSLVALGLVLLTGIGGLTSFGQAAFVGLGAYVTAGLTTATGLPAWLAWVGASPWLTLLAGLAFTFAFALALGALSLKLSGHYLPLSTIAWGISLYFLFGNVEFLGGHTGITGVPAIEFFGIRLDTGRSIFWLIWAFVAIAIVTMQNLLDSREGRAIRALRGGRVMAESMGVNTAASRIVIFVIAALLASVSGWLYAHLQRFLNPTPFSLNAGIEYLFMAVVGGAGYVWGAIIGATLITILRDWLKDVLPAIVGQAGDYEVIVFGILMVLVLQHAPQGLWPLLTSRFTRRGAGEPVRADAAPLATRPRPPKGELLLSVERVTRRFGGLVAVNEMSLEVRAGEIVALIGPNGAGKSTMFNLVSGVDDPTAGEVRFRGELIASAGKAQPARLVAARGIGRTFQHVRLLPQMSVLENVAIGAHRRENPGLLAGVLTAAWRLDRREEARLRAEAMRQLERVGLAEHAGDAAGSLALGQQRLLEIARALAGDPLLLLLDEPAAGLRYREKRALAALLASLRDEGLGILLVEHDMDFVMNLADRCVVMDFGTRIAAGLPQEVQRDPRVVEAYLGGVE